MGSQWVLNMSGGTLSEEKMNEIPHPTTELYIHVVTKTVQAFSILGLGIAGPITAVVKGNRNWAGIKESSLKCGRGGAVIGLALGPLMTYMKMKGSDTYGYTDRCYRLRYNRNQVRVDRMSYVGAAAGAGAMAYLGGSPVNGVVLGLSAGCLLGAAYNTVCGGSKKKKVPTDMQKKHMHEIRYM